MVVARSLGGLMVVVAGYLARKSISPQVTRIVSCQNFGVFFFFFLRRDFGVSLKSLMREVFFKLFLGQFLTSNKLM